MKEPIKEVFATTLLDFIKSRKSCVLMARSIHAPAFNGQLQSMMGAKF